MKELTIEQKAKRYDLTIERARKVLLDCTPQEQKVVEYIFSKLKESEDEVMRAMAIKAVHAPAAQSCIKSWGINPNDVIAWLEKHEWKPSDIQIETLKIVKDYVVSNNWNDCVCNNLKNLLEQLKKL